MLFTFLLYAERSLPSHSVHVKEAIITMTLFLIIVF